MSHSTQPSWHVRAINTVLAAALCAYLLIAYLPIVKVFELSRADLQYQGEWIGGYGKRITSVAPGGVADRAGLKPGDVLEFDPSRNDDWVLASYRDMPEGFTGTMPVRHADGSRSVVTLAPERVAYLPTLNDRLAVLARLLALFTAMLIGVTMVWARPSLMTWSLLLYFISALPLRPWGAYFLAFEAAGPGLDLRTVLPASTLFFALAVLPFALCFPRAGLDDWARWKRIPLLTVLVACVVVFAAANPALSPFVSDMVRAPIVVLWTSVLILGLLGALVALVRTYHRSGSSDRARLKWTLLGMSGALAGSLLAFLLIVVRSVIPNELSGRAATPGHWVTTICTVVFSLSFGYAVLRQRVVDIQFAISRTVVYGVVSTIVLLFLAVLHWLLGRVIEHSGFAFGVEGLAAVGLGLVLHRASHGINTTVDRVLFRKHHAAEERLRQVTAALPFASTEQSIAQAIVEEPTRNLELASAALFYREGSEGPLERVLAVGWGEWHAATLDAESLLVRYLQAGHSALRLGEGQEWLPAGMPEGAAHPVLAIPIVTQHVLTAVVLYGAHVNSTLPDPDEVVLLEALANAAAASHQQVRIAMLARENASLSQEIVSLAREKEGQQKMIERIEARLGVLVQERGAGG